MKKPTIHSWFLRFVGITGILLQAYLFLYGCSNPANYTVTADAPSAPLLYSAKCASCHRLLPPEDYSAQTWRHYVDKYGKKLTDVQKQQMLDYLIVNASDAPKTNIQPGNL